MKHKRNRPVFWFHRSLCIATIGVLLAGCVPYQNTPFRTADPVDCTDDACSEHTLIERHEKYDLAYVEFTERGNVFNRARMQKVLDHVSRQAGYDPLDPTRRDTTRSVTAVVFVHGWKHNARKEDSNVESFRKLLEYSAPLQTGNRRLVGIYIGWRGLSVDAPVIKELSYWDRKAVAHQVGKGGVTEILLRLEKIVVDDRDPNRNVYLVTGHSFGGAIVLSALSEVLLERIVDARSADKPDGRCLLTRPFGHGVVLLNPAIEANEALQLKERVTELSRQRKFCLSQDRLLHVISSYADAATDKAFRWGQRLGVNLTWRQATLERNLSGKTLELEESELDTTTIGNFTPFQTGRLERLGAREWKYHSCIENEKDCVCVDQDGNECAAAIGQHIPVQHNEPLAFIRTDRKQVADSDENFISDHNDVFNVAVSAYLATIVAEARYKRSLEEGRPKGAEVPQQCHGDGVDFPFGRCFDLYQCRFKAARNGQSSTCGK